MDPQRRLEQLLQEGCDEETLRKTIAELRERPAVLYSLRQEQERLARVGRVRHRRVVRIWIGAAILTGSLFLTSSLYRWLEMPHALWLNAATAAFLFVVISIWARTP